MRDVPCSGWRPITSDHRAAGERAYDVVGHEVGSVKRRLGAIAIGVDDRLASGVTRDHRAPLIFDVERAEHAAHRHAEPCSSPSQPARARRRRAPPPGLTSTAVAPRRRLVGEHDREAAAWPRR